MSENYNEVEKLEIRPFTKFCMSIGAVPSSYLAGLSIEEQLLWLCSYLEKEVIPTVNNNGESVEELQELFTELQTYVNNYFTNLDVQDEINDKLDAMALNGTLATIINQEIFGEINESISTINGEITEINNNITDTNTRIDNLEIKPTIFIGDSYGRISNNGWVEKMAFKLGLTLGTNAWKFCRDGAGFARENNTFLDLLQENETAITDKTSVKNIFVCGGLNDINANSASDITNAIGTFATYCLTNYPNAHIYIGCIGWNSSPSNSSANIRNQVLNKVLLAYQSSSGNKNCTYLNGVEYVLHYYSLLDVDASHPGAVGQAYLANAIYQAYYNGYYNFTTSLVTTTIASGLFVQTQIMSNQLLFRLEGAIISNLADTTTKGIKTQVIGACNTAYMRNVNDFSHIPISFYANLGAGGMINLNGYITINEDRNMVLTWYNPTTTQYLAIGFMSNNQISNNLLFF